MLLPTLVRASKYYFDRLDRGDMRPQKCPDLGQPMVASVRCKEACRVADAGGRIDGVSQRPVLGLQRLDARP